MTYIGIVIGGPKAGQTVAMDQPSLRIAEAPSLQAFDPEAKFDPYETYKVYAYQHVPFGIKEKGNDTVWGFWVEYEESYPMTEVMDTLVRNYQANARPKR